MRGITVTLYERTQSGTDSLGNPIWTTEPVEVDDVLIGEPTTDEINSSISLEGKRIAYTLGIPKGDTHSWEGCRVDFFGQKFQCYGNVTQGIEAMIPLRWNKKVHVACYDAEDVSE